MFLNSLFKKGHNFVFYLIIFELGKVGVIEVAAEDGREPAEGARPERPLGVGEFVTGRGQQRRVADVGRF